jgi:hypothetical protein
MLDLSCRIAQIGKRSAGRASRARAEMYSSQGFGLLQKDSSSLVLAR